MRKWQTSHSFQGSIKQRNFDTWNRFVERSDYEVLQHMDHYHRNNHNVDLLPIPPEALELCKDPENIDPFAELDLIAEGVSNALPNLIGDDDDFGFDLE